MPGRGREPSSGLGAGPRGPGGGARNRARYRSGTGPKKLWDSPGAGMGLAPQPQTEPSMRGRGYHPETGGLPCDFSPTPYTSGLPIVRTQVRRLNYSVQAACLSYPSQSCPNTSEAMWNWFTARRMLTASLLPTPLVLSWNTWELDRETKV